VEACSFFDFVDLLGEGDALIGDLAFEIFDRREVLVDNRLIDQRPQCLGWL
jgi:hypothetical protein